MIIREMKNQKSATENTIVTNTPDSIENKDRNLLLLL